MRWWRAALKADGGGACEAGSHTLGGAEGGMPAREAHAWAGGGGRQGHGGRTELLRALALVLGLYNEEDVLRLRHRRQQPARLAQLAKPAATDGARGSVALAGAA